MDRLATCAERLRVQRAKARLTQADLAEKIGVSQNAIGTWERGESSPQAPEVAKLCSCFGVSADYLTGLSPYESGLSPDTWLVNLDLYEQRTARVVWSWKVPRRLRIVDYDELQRMEARAKRKPLKTDEAR